MTQGFSIQQFCEDHGISRALYYKMLRDGKAPIAMHLGKRRIISAESAAAWRKQMEAVK